MFTTSTLLLFITHLFGPCAFLVAVSSCIVVRVHAQLETITLPAHYLLIAYVSPAQKVYERKAMSFVRSMTKYELRVCGNKKVCAISL